MPGISTRPSGTTSPGTSRSPWNRSSTPLAADAAHPFPFISNLGLNLAVLVTEPGRRNRRFVRIKVPPNSPRWVPLPDDAGWVPLEQVIAGNLGALFPRAAETGLLLLPGHQGGEG